MFCLSSAQKTDIRFFFFGHAIDEESHKVFLVLAASTLACGWKGLNYDANVVLMYFFPGVKYHIL